MGKRDEIRDHYAEVAQSAAQGGASPEEGACCAPTSCCGAGETRLYPEDVQNGLPLAALKASRGCGNPLSQVQLKPGMTVLDLGSGGGIDCLIAAQDVGPAGKVYGLDMTDEMLALANENKRIAGADNVQFVKGFIEDIPLPDDLADVITSNCVINLSEDKARVLREAYRVLKPGGRFVVADLITLKPELEDEAGLQLARLFGCRAGVLCEASYAALMAQAGFAGIAVRPYDVSDAASTRARAERKGMQDVLAQYDDEVLEGALAAVFVQGVKPPRRTQEEMGKACGRAIAFVLATGEQPGDIGAAIAAARQAHVAAVYVLAKPAFAGQAAEAVRLAGKKGRTLVQALEYDPAAAEALSAEAGGFELSPQLPFGLLETMRMLAEMSLDDFEAVVAIEAAPTTVDPQEAAAPDLTAERIYDLCQELRQHSDVEVAAQQAHGDAMAAGQAESPAPQTQSDQRLHLPCAVSRAFLERMEQRDPLLCSAAEPETARVARVRVRHIA